MPEPVLGGTSLNGGRCHTHGHKSQGLGRHPSASRVDLMGWRLLGFQQMSASTGGDVLH